MLNRFRRFGWNLSQPVLLAGAAVLFTVGQAAILQAQAPRTILRSDQAQTLGAHFESGQSHHQRAQHRPSHHQQANRRQANLHQADQQPRQGRLQNLFPPPQSTSRTHIRLTSERDQRAQHSSVAPVSYDEERTWRGRDEASSPGDSTYGGAPTARVARAPSLSRFAEGDALPLNGPATGSGQADRDSGPAWTPRATGARLLNEPYAPDRAGIAPAYRSAQIPDAKRPATGAESHRSTADPFDDPFGDGIGTAPLTVRTPLRQNTPAGQDPPAADKSPTRQDPAQSQPSTAPPMPPRKPCGHIFNEVDCCEEGRKCDRLLHSLQQQSIRQISLDMTPRFLPGADAATEADHKATRLSGVKPKDWKDNEGQLLAHGRLVDLRDQRVIVETDEGEEVRLVFRHLSEIDRCYVTAWWSLPTECNLGDKVYAGRHFMPITMTWKASALCHKPLYFEEVQLERYGHTMGPWLQPTFSSAHFFANAITLPYHMGVHPLNECQYPLGHYRPGDCAPWLLPATPISLRGALWQTGAVLGGVYALP